MTDDIAIKVENLTKIYKLYDSPADRLKESLHWRGKKYHKDFYALNNISFEIKKGDCFGILGKNGAGKSTLLKIITGVLTQSSGNISVNGKISALLELGAGFNPEYTGLENIYFQGNLMGYTRDEMKSKIPEIMTFADIGDFIHQPVKMYSSGMFARLAFAVAINVEPDILIVDEALSVGDMFFQAKCMSRMKQLINNEHVTILFVSHDISSVKALCNKAILLDNGNLELVDDAAKVVEKYFANRFVKKNFIQPEHGGIKNRITNKQNLLYTAFNYSDELFNKTSMFQRIRNGKADFTNVVLLDENENQIEQTTFGDTVILRCFIRAHEDIHNLSFGFHIRNSNGVDILYDDTVLLQCDLIYAKSHDEYIVDWKFKINLQSGNYNIATVASIPINLDVADVDMCDFVPIAKQFIVVSEYSKVYAAVHANSEFSIAKIN